ncbi:cytochrome c oxidase assembly protein [Ornithinibacillus xuwenensis]|uniref:Cytochrome c oxidase assembly protein n=1 Tax=Ornithinibacillus xuwenensis TaxID=3144668 RepID=A0ABU9XGT1_9BACI
MHQENIGLKKRNIYQHLILKWYSIYYVSPRVTYLVMGVSLLIYLNVYPISEEFPLTYSIHMLEISLIYFLTPPLLLLGSPRRFTSLNHSSRIHSLLKFTPLFSLFIFALLLTLQHTSSGIERFEQLGITSTFLKWFMFLLALDMWRPILPSKQNSWFRESRKRYMTINMIVLLPACTYLLFDAVLSPIDHMVLIYSMAFCLPEGMTLDQVSSFLLPPRFDQVIAAVIMIVFHKGSVTLFNRVHRKYKYVDFVNK